MNTFGEQCQVGDRVRIVTNPRPGTYVPEGAGEVLQVYEGVNRACLVRVDGGGERVIGWRNLRREYP